MGLATLRLVHGRSVLGSAATARPPRSGTDAALRPLRSCARSRRRSMR